MAIFPLRCLVLAAGFALSSASAWAQGPSPAEEERVREMAEQISDLMAALGERAEGYPAFIADLEAGLITIEQADEQVALLIQQLNEAIAQMEDGSDFDDAIDAYVDSTTALISEAEASANQAIRSTAPALREILDGLEADDARRAATVIEARNLVRVLEQNREALAFFIRANQVAQAAALIHEHVEEFQKIVEDGKVLASDLLQPANP